MNGDKALLYQGGIQQFVPMHLSSRIGNLQGYKLQYSLNYNLAPFKMISEKKKVKQVDVLEG